MRLFNFLVLVALVFSYVIAGNYEMTYYGCPDECGKQENPSCGLPIYPLEHGATKFFAALVSEGIVIYNIINLNNPNYLKYI